MQFIVSIFKCKKCGVNCMFLKYTIPHLQNLVFSFQIDEFGVTSLNGIPASYDYSDVENLHIFTTIYEYSFPPAPKGKLSSILKFTNEFDIYSFKEGTINSNADIYIGLNCSINSNFNEFIKKPTEYDLLIVGRIDSYGCNLGEVIVEIKSNRSYPNGYPSEHIGLCVNIKKDDIYNNPNIITTLYSLNPNINKTIKRIGKTLIEKCIYLRKKYDVQESKCEFYDSMLSYIIYRYVLAGLCVDSKFSKKWMYLNNYLKFFKNLRCSEFKQYIVLFTSTYNDYNKFFTECNCNNKI